MAKRFLWSSVVPVFALAFLAGGVTAGPPDKLPGKDPGQLIVHEWGTFLSVQGSDGVALGGMIDSEEALPPFVRERTLTGLPRWSINQKMETPVTYFYVDRPQKVEVRVAMPEGRLTHWYPAVAAFGPRIEVKGNTAAGGSFLDWQQILLLPDNLPIKKADGQLKVASYRQVAPGSTWRFARETDAAFVKIDGNPKVRRGVGEMEKFLFYRGLANLDLPLQVRSTGEGEGVRLTLVNRAKEDLHGLFAVRVEQDAIQFAALAHLAAGSSQEGTLGSILSPKMALKDGVPVVKQAVADTLVQSGLFPKEALAMVNTWEKSYFRTNGLRMLYVLPRPCVDAAIPIQIKPAPDQLNRVMVGRVEVLTPGMEKRIEKVVTDLGAKDPAVKKVATVELTKLGRLQEPVLRRVIVLTTVPQVRTQAETIIKIRIGSNQN